MDNKYKNICIRCGKERIISKSWKEITVNASGLKQEIVYTETVCPDSACQRILNQEFAKQKKKRLAITKEREQRAKDNKEKMSKLKAFVKGRGTKKQTGTPNTSEVK